MDWKQAKVGCYWSADEYAIATVSGGGRPAEYYLFFRCQQLGYSHPTLQAAKEAAERHAIHERMGDR
jgi:hypothetical protein